MKVFFKKRLACLLCIALLVGWLPVDSAKMAGASPQKIYIVGCITGDFSVQLRVDMDKLDVLNVDDLDFAWYVGSTTDDLDLLNETTCLTIQPGTTSLPSSGYIKVEAKLHGEVVGYSLKQFKNMMKVDSLSGVDAYNVSAPGMKDGSITGTTQDMVCYDAEVNHYTCGTYISGLAEGEYTVGYDEETRKKTVFPNGFYATYKIGVNDGAQATGEPNPTLEPTKLPDSTPEPTKVPEITTEPTKAPEDTMEPTKMPDGSAKPTEVPDSTLEPTKAPGNTTEPTKVPSNTTVPTKVPGQTEEPTKAPSSSQDPSQVDITKPGITVTVVNVIYISNGSGSVSYAGIKTGKKTVTVPDKVTINGKSYPVTTISSGAFSGSKVQNVKLGKNVKVIGKKAFKNCKNLKKVTFSNKTTTVSAEAFSGCAKLGSVSLPASVKTVGAKAFKNCKKLKKFKLGKTPLKTKKGNVMFGAVGGKKVAIGASALENCLNLRSVIINSQVTKIGNNTFKNCKKLASMLVKSLKLKTVGNRALKGVNHCKISVPTIRLKKYRTLFTNKGQGKKVVIAKV